MHLSSSTFVGGFFLFLSGLFCFALAMAPDGSDREDAGMFFVFGDGILFFDIFWIDGRDSSMVTSTSSILTFNISKGLYVEILTSVSCEAFFIGLEVLAGGEFPGLCFC